MGVKYEFDAEGRGTFHVTVGDGTPRDKALIGLIGLVFMATRREFGKPLTAIIAADFADRALLDAGPVPVPSMPRPATKQPYTNKYQCWAMRRSRTFWFQMGLLGATAIQWLTRVAL